MRYVIFDLDETLGYFTQVYILCIKFESLMNYKLTTNNLLELYKEFELIFRPGLMVLMAYVKVLKETRGVKVILYTNTTMKMIWVKSLLLYIDKKIHANTKLFDIIIGLESACRTTLKKTKKDILRCISGATSDSKLLVIDDKLHKDLIHDNTMYHEIDNYVYYYNNNDIWQYIHKVANKKCTVNVSKNKLPETLNVMKKERSRKEIMTLINKLKEFVR